MRKRFIRSIIVLVCIFLIVTFFWKALLPNQLEYTINDYFEGISYHENTIYKIHNTAKWFNGELVVVEGKEMIGVVYLEKVFGIYKVKNHALCNKTDTVTYSFMRDIEYQYRLLRVKSFVENKDIIIAYVNDTKINSFELENESNELIFLLPENRKLIFSEAEQLFSIIKTQSDEIDETFIEWKDENLQDMIKYNTNDLICKSDKPLNIAVIGLFDFKTDDNILIENVSLDKLQDLDSDEYDALFINSSISNGTVDELVKKNWHVYIIDPLKNLDSIGNTNVGKNVIIIEKSINSGGSCSKSDYYDLDSNYFMAYNYIFESLSNRKK